jgi:hypothetical protein
MTQFRYMRGAVYILENLEAQRIKIGMSTNNVALRLREANDMWLEYKVTCQVCGARRLAKLNGFGPRLVPKHAAKGIPCPGGGALPLESDTALAEAQLERMKLQKGLMTRQINTLEERIRLRRQHNRAAGKWTIAAVYQTECAEQVELLSHTYLAERLDRSAPFGEVFCCSMSDAQGAVERALAQLGLPHSVSRLEAAPPNNSLELSRER